MRSLWEAKLIQVVYGCEGAAMAPPKEVVEIDGVLTYTCPECRAAMAALLAEAA